jgi:xanthine dehydrogenase accessory factor
VREIRQALQWCKLNRRPCVVATVIHVEGSAYQREDSRCIIHESGEIVGMLSGGCMEEDIKEHALTLLATDGPQTARYDFRGHEDQMWGLDSSCGGDVTIWLELFDPERFTIQALSLLDDLEHRAGCSSAYYSVTVIESQNPDRFPVGHRWNMDADTVGVLLPTGLASLIGCELREIKLSLFVERVQPRPRLSIIGTGADVALLCRMAKAHEWHVDVVFHETARANAKYFPEADEIILVPRGDFSGLVIHPDHYVVVMSHHLEIDQEAVKQLLPTSVRYVGLLGSKSRVRRIVDSFRSESPDFEGNLLEKLFAPVGLDIGAQTPEEITLSIMAELLAHRNRASGVFLREKVRNEAGGSPRE